MRKTGRVVGCSLALLCACKEVPHAESDPVASLLVAPARVAEEKATPAPSRPFVYMTPIDGGAAVEVWLPGAPARSLGVRADFGGDSFGRGAIGPRLAPDGQRLAYRQGGSLRLRRLDTADETALVEYAADQVELRLTGWAPDGSSLLFHLEARYTDVPLPRGVAPGFWVARADGTPPTRLAGLPELPGVLAWLSTGDAVIYTDRGGADETTLMRRAVDPRGKPTRLHTIAGADGFTDLAVGGDAIFYVHDRSVIRSRLDGERSLLVGPGPDARYARPRPSPDGTRVAYLDERTIKVIAPGASVASTVDECETLRCTHAWANDEALLVVDSGSLRRVELDGRRTRIADGVVAASISGE